MSLAVEAEVIVAGLVGLAGVALGIVNLAWHRVDRRKDGEWRSAKDTELAERDSGWSETLHRMAKALEGQQANLEPTQPTLRFTSRHRAKDTVQVRNPGPETLILTAIEFPEKGDYSVWDYEITEPIELVAGEVFEFSFAGAWGTQSTIPVLIRWRDPAGLGHERTATLSP